MYLSENQIIEVLHQRPPYLMVNEVMSCDKNLIKSRKNFSGAEPFVLGHFPGAPVVPGAMIQELCTQSAGVLLSKFYSPVENYNSLTTKGYALGVLRKVDYAKFTKIVKPTIPLDCKVELIESVDNLFHFKAEVFQGEKRVAQLGFSLVNISDDKIM